MSHSVRLALKVVPGSSQDRVAGWLEDILKVRVRAPPERGKANAAVEKLVADALIIPQDAVRIVSGMTAARKTVEISGLSLAEIYRRLSKPRVGPT
jgi:uncharacterized protein (TIGR00251 family)